MPFLSLSLCNFRNLKNDSLNLSSKEVFFVGENGQGKSNLLESLYYASYGSSFRTHLESQIIKEGEQFSFAKNGMHFVKATKKFKMALVILFD